MKLIFAVLCLALVSAQKFRKGRKGRKGKRNDESGINSQNGTFSVTGPTKFKIALWGDLPYLGSEVDVFDGVYGPNYAALRDTMNAAGVEFAVHTGDVKGGSSPCGELNYKRFEDLSNSLQFPSFLTLGDNGWTDCHRLAAGNYDPLDRLAHMRSRFFKPTGGSVMGSGFMTSDVKANYYPENQIFSYGNIAHAIAHVVGTNNALYDGTDAKCDQYHDIIDLGCQAAVAEHRARDLAVNKLITDTFSMAKKNNMKAVMIYIQANIFGGPCGDPSIVPACAEDRYSCACCDITQSVYISSGFRNFWGNLVVQARRFDGPVILVHGDSHYFQVYPNPNGDADNIIAVQVPGSGDIGWIEANIDSAGPWASFSFKMINNNPDSNYYADCPKSPNLQFLEIVEGFPM